MVKTKIIIHPVWTTSTKVPASTDGYKMILKTENSMLIIERAEILIFTQSWRSDE